MIKYIGDKIGAWLFGILCFLMYLIKKKDEKSNE